MGRSCARFSARAVEGWLRTPLLFKRGALFSRRGSPFTKEPWPIGAGGLSSAGALAASPACGVSAARCTSAACSRRISSTRSRRICTACSPWDKKGATAPGATGGGAKGSRSSATVALSLGGSDEGRSGGRRRWGWGGSTTSARGRRGEFTPVLRKLRRGRGSGRRRLSSGWGRRRLFRCFFLAFGWARGRGGLSCRSLLGVGGLRVSVLRSGSLRRRPLLLVRRGRGLGR